MQEQELEFSFESGLLGRFRLNQAFWKLGLAEVISEREGSFRKVGLADLSLDAVALEKW
jgi:hypothetical protein